VPPHAISPVRRAGRSPAGNALWRLCVRYHSIRW
jgi:hypothetical protein